MLGSVFLSALNYPIYDCFPFKQLRSSWNVFCESFPLYSCIELLVYSTFLSLKVLQSNRVHPVLRNVLYSKWGENTCFLTVFWIDTSVVIQLFSDKLLRRSLGGNVQYKARKLVVGTFYLSLFSLYSRPAPLLKNVQLSESKARELYLQVIQYMRRMYQDARLVHADLSEFNML